MSRYPPARPSVPFGIRGTPWKFGLSCLIAQPRVLSNYFRRQGWMFHHQRSLSRYRKNIGSISASMLPTPARGRDGWGTMKTLAEEVSEKIARLEARVVVDEEACKHLRELWNLIWTEWCYDPASESSQRFAGQLKPHIDALNAKFKFK